MNQILIQGIILIIIIIIISVLLVREYFVVPSADITTLSNNCVSNISFYLPFETPSQTTAIQLDFTPLSSITNNTNFNLFATDIKNKVRTKAFDLLKKKFVKLKTDITNAYCGVIVSKPETYTKFLERYREILVPFIINIGYFTEYARFIYINTTRPQPFTSHFITEEELLFVINSILCIRHTKLIINNPNELPDSFAEEIVRMSFKVAKKEICYPSLTNKDACYDYCFNRSVDVRETIIPPANSCPILFTPPPDPTPKSVPGSFTIFDPTAGTQAPAAGTTGTTAPPASGTGTTGTTGTTAPPASGSGTTGTTRPPASGSGTTGTSGTTAPGGASLTDPAPTVVIDLGPNSMPSSFEETGQGVQAENSIDDQMLASVGDYEFGVEVPDIYLENSKGPNNFFIPHIIIEEEFNNKNKQYEKKEIGCEPKRIKPIEPYNYLGGLNYQLLY